MKTIAERQTKKNEFKAIICDDSTCVLSYTLTSLQNVRASAWLWPYTIRKHPNCDDAMECPPLPYICTRQPTILFSSTTPSATPPSYHQSIVCWQSDRIWPSSAGTPSRVPTKFVILTLGFRSSDGITFRHIYSHSLEWHSSAARKGLTL